MKDEPAVKVREIERLRVLAQWYRDWAGVAGSGDDRNARLGLAEYIDAKARAMLRDLPA
jgi:hypothetical protein